MLISLAGLYAKKNTVMQVHLSVIRNINAAAFNSIGVNTGYDAVNDRKLSSNTAKLLNRMELNGLPKTILYSLNPKDYYPLATIMGGFQCS